MTTPRITLRLLAGLTLTAGLSGTGLADVPALTVEKALIYKPRQANVTAAMPTAAELARCRIDTIPNPKQAGSVMGYIVRDAEGRPLRQFVSYDNKQFNILSYYVEGQEAYREIDSNLDGTPDQYRWLGVNGSKWGVDRDQDGKIDSWAVLSPEEASQEILAALAAKDGKRFEALLPSKEDVDGMNLPAAEATRIKTAVAGAGKKLSDAVAKMPLSPAARWMHVEFGAPHITPADAFGGKDDLASHKAGMIVLDENNQTQFIQTGELVLIGRAWKVVEGPSAGVSGGNQGGLDIDLIKAEIAELDAHDKTAPEATTPEAQASYSLKRAAILGKIVTKLPADKQEMWLKQQIDSLTTAVESGKAPEGSKPLDPLKDLAAKLPPASPLAAYTSFRILIAENAVALSAGGNTNVQAVQDKWRANLEDFIKKFPAAEDAPEAALRLAMAFEFLGKEGETKSKQWYGDLVRAYPQHPHAAKAAGAVRRLEAEGQPLQLQGSTLAGQPFALNQFAGKAIVVYYWASWSTNLADDAQKLKNLISIYGSKGVELVTINLDDDARSASATVTRLGLPGTHLHQPGGLDKSPLASAYGIMVVPHVFVADKAGKVVNRNAQVGTLEDDLKKVTQ